MESFCSIVRPRFRKHWRAVSCQIHAVNNNENPKRGFLFDCGAANVDILIDLVVKLKDKKLIDENILVAVVKDDIFILNVKKFTQESFHVVIDISGSLEKPKIFEDSSLTNEMFQDLNNQIRSSDRKNLTQLEIKAGWCVPTVFGYLINYPALYYYKPGDDTNCLSLIDLSVHQIITSDLTLISFSVPTELYDKSQIVRERIETWLHNFQNNDEFVIKTFIANYPIVIL